LAKTAIRQEFKLEREPAWGGSFLLALRCLVKTCVMSAIPVFKKIKAALMALFWFHLLFY